MEFGEKLRKLRTEKGLTQLELAKLLNTTLKTISNYEINGVLPRYRSRYQDIATLFDVPISYLLTNEENCTNSYPSKPTTKDREIIVNNMIKIFTNPKIAQTEKDTIFQTIQEVYWFQKIEQQKKLIKQRLKNQLKC